jgi:CheY-like chemotaxis protein
MYASDPSKADLLTDANRHFHTLKGSSPLVGARPVSEVSRTVEACLKRILSDPELFTPRLLATLRFAITLMKHQVEDFVSGQPIRDGESAIRTIRSHMPMTQSVEELMQNLELMSQELRNSLGETVQLILGRELDEGKRLFVLHVPPHEEMQNELPRIRAGMKEYGSILSVAGREEGSIHILLSSSFSLQILQEKMQGFRATLTELLSKDTMEKEPARPALDLRQPKTSVKREGKFRVLFSDDSQIARDLYRILLQRNGYEVEVAQDGSEALQKLRASSFDAVITDDQMPAMDGSELLEVAKNDERFYHIPFILISGHASDEARSNAINNGAAAYLVKGSFEKEQLLVILREAIEKAQG